MAKQREKQQGSLEMAIENFFSCELAERAAMGLSERACIALYVDEAAFYFTRRDGKNALLRRAPNAPDLEFWLTEDNMRHFMELAELPGMAISTMGVELFEAIFSKDITKKLRFRVQAPFLTLFSKGYFSILKAGGPEVASYITGAGIIGFAQLRVMLQKIRGE